MKVLTQSPRNSLGSWFLISLITLLLSFTNVSAQTTVTPTYPSINSFLWGNTSVNAVGKTQYVNGTGYPYRYITPKNFNPSQKYPVIIFLHGVGEAGTDNLLPLQANNNTANGVLALVSTANPDNQTNFPCFFIVPQMPVNETWSDNAAATAIQNLLQIFETQYASSFDTSRIYVTGLSEGGTGSYDLPYLLSQSNHLGFNPFAAAAPMSGSFGAYIARPISSQPFMPIWAFHAANDPDAPIATSDDTAVAGLRSLGFSVVYSRYNLGKHAIWELSYQQPQLLPWLFAQTLGQAAQAPLSGFAVTGETQPTGTSVLNLSGTTTATEGFTGVTWTDDANSQSGAAPTPITPTWAINNIPVAAGTNHVQVTATAPNNTAAIFGTATDYGGKLTVNLPFSVSPTTNLALGATVTVSTIDGAGDAGPNAVDGNTTTRWSSNYWDPQWIQVDLGANYDISEVDLNWQTACGKDYQIQTSPDGTTWTTQTIVTGNTKSGLLAYKYGNVAVQSARYVRMYGTARATPWGYSLYEIAVFAQNSTVTSPVLVSNIALKKPVTVSSIESSGTPGANAVDGNVSTRWSTLYSDPQWIQIDLGADYNISEIDLNWETACGKNYQIQTSTDGNSWTTQTTVTGNTTAGLLTYPYATAISGRYVRVYGTARATPYGYSLYEVSVYSDGTTQTPPPPPPSLTNVALNKTTSVSSVETNGTPGSLAVDGNTTTRWSSLYTDPQYIEIDLGTDYDINEVDLTWETACGKNYQIQTSDDNIHWSTQTAVTGNTTSGQLLAYQYATPVIARYIRMYGTARNTQYGYSLFEFAVLSDGVATGAPPVLTNLALNQPVTVSSIESASFPGSAAVDGDSTTRWSSAFSDNQWIVVDLGAAHNISEIDLNWEGACGMNYQIQTSLDGTTWTTQNTVTGNQTSGLLTYAYSAPVSGRYVRMLGTARATPYGYSLYEISVLGQ